MHALPHQHNIIYHLKGWKMLQPLASHWCSRILRMPPWTTCMFTWNCVFIFLITGSKSCNASGVVLNVSFESAMGQEHIEVTFEEVNAEKKIIFFRCALSLSLDIHWFLNESFFFLSRHFIIVNPMFIFVTKAICLKEAREHADAIEQHQLVWRAVWRGNFFLTSRHKEKGKQAHQDKKY